MTYQIEPKNLTEVLNQQLGQLNWESQKTGKAITPLLETNLPISFTPSNSGGEESEDININNSVPKIMDGGTSVHEKKKPENKATTNQSCDQNRRKDKK